MIINSEKGFFWNDSFKSTLESGSSLQRCSLLPIMNDAFMSLARKSMGIIPSLFLIAL
jgi:hypothetical protein